MLKKIKILNSSYFIAKSILFSNLDYKDILELNRMNIHKVMLIESEEIP